MIPIMDALLALDHAKPALQPLNAPPVPLLDTLPTQPESACQNAVMDSSSELKLAILETSIPKAASTARSETVGPALVSPQFADLTLQLCPQFKQHPQLPQLLQSQQLPLSPLFPLLHFHFPRSET